MKRYFLFVLISFFSCGVISTFASKPLKGKTIVIDPGHGGVDPGTIYKDIYESDINLNISLYLKDELEKLGSNVIIIRDGDYDLSAPKAFYRKKSDFDNRIKIINNYANYYLSIHLNYLDDEKYYGSQVFSSKGEFSNAQTLQKHLNKKLGFKRDNKLIPSNTYMYQRLTRPGLLVECGFLSNYNEREKLITKEYQHRLAKEIARGLLKLKF